MLFPNLLYVTKKSHIQKKERISILSPYIRHKHFLAPRRALLLSFLRKQNKGGASVEALMILPFVLTFMMSFVWLIDVFRIHTQIGVLISEAGSELVAYSYPNKIISDALIDGEEANELFELVESIGYSGAFLLQMINSEAYIEDIQIVSGYIDTVSENRTIQIEVIYKVKPKLWIPGFEGFILSNRFYSKTYEGFYTQQGNDEYVYITKGSEVYHSSKECTALKTTINTVLYSDIDKKRNKNGSKYYECERCKGQGNQGLVFITPYGSRYHFAASCQNLKTSVYKIVKSEIGERRKCYFCD